MKKKEESNIEREDQKLFQAITKKKFLKNATINFPQKKEMSFGRLKDVPYSKFQFGWKFRLHFKKNINT